MGHNSLKNYLSFIWNWNWTGHHVFYRIILAPPLKVKVLVSQFHWTLCDPVDYSMPGSSVHGILQIRILVARDWTWVFCVFFLTQGLNLSLLRVLHRQADALLLHHLGNPFHLCGRLTTSPRKRPKALRSGGFPEATTLMYLTSKSTSPLCSDIPGTLRTPYLWQSRKPWMTRHFWIASVQESEDKIYPFKKT